MAVAQPERPKKIDGHSGPVRCVLYSPDGKIFASASDDGTIKLWDPATLKEIRTLTGHEGPVRCLRFFAKGKKIASGGAYKTIKVWDVATGKLIKTLDEGDKEKTDETVLSLAFNPDESRMASTNAGDIKIWHVRELGELDPPDGEERHTDWVHCLSYSPDGKLLLSGSCDRTIRVWDLDDEDNNREIRGHKDWVRCLAYSPDGKLLATGSRDATIRLWDPATWKEKANLKHPAAVNAIAYSPDGKTLAAACEDEMVRMWDLATNKELWKMEQHRGPVYGVAVSPDGKTMVSGSGDKTILVWKLQE